MSRSRAERHVAARARLNTDRIQRSNLSPWLRPGLILRVSHPTEGASRGIVGRLGLRASCPEPLRARQARRCRLRPGPTGRPAPSPEPRTKRNPRYPCAEPNGARSSLFETSTSTRHRHAAVDCELRASPRMQQPENPAGQAWTGPSVRGARFCQPFRRHPGSPLCSAGVIPGEVTGAPQRPIDAVRIRCHVSINGT